MLVSTYSALPVGCMIKRLPAVRLATPFLFATLHMVIPSLTEKSSHLCGRTSASGLSVFGFASMSSKARMGAVSTRERL